MRHYPHFLLSDDDCCRSMEKATDKRSETDGRTDGRTLGRFIDPAPHTMLTASIRFFIKVSTTTGFIHPYSVCECEVFIQLFWRRYWVCFNAVRVTKTTVGPFTGFSRLNWLPNASWIFRFLDVKCTLQHLKSPPSRWQFNLYRAQTVTKFLSGVPRTHALHGKRTKADRSELNLPHGANN